MLKTHKSGSSTLQNIILRYAEKHNLSVVLPKEGHQLGYPENFDLADIIRAPWGQYNILTNHVRFSPDKIYSLMPRDTIYITILRNPIMQFESLFNYYRLGDVVRVRSLTDPLSTFLRSPHSYPRNYFTKNNYMYDLGFSEDDWNTPDKIRDIIRTVDKIFDFVFISEYFDESLILLRHAMCWSIRDIAYFSVNVRHRSSTRAVTPWMEQQIKKWNVGDYQLYRYFNKTFWQKVYKFGIKRMEKEKHDLQREIQIYIERCIDDVTVNGKGIWHLDGVYINSYKLKPSARNDVECIGMTKPELTFTQELVSKQRRRNKEFRLQNNGTLGRPFSRITLNGELRY
ncbi:galactose-3-O-sulfotransferase 3-like [Saccoglossus kowalevskii]